MRNTITPFLLRHSAQQPVSFHMPGHKGAAIYRDHGYGPFLDHIMDCDITEIPGADNLFQTEGPLLHTMDRYRKLYGVRQSYMLINGSSGGLIAAILASVPRGGRLILARNCHKSIFNALSLGDITPIYAYPRTIAEYGILGDISVEEIVRCMDEAPDAAAVVIPSPNYYGICSDIEAIAKEVHRRGKVLIVDQAHGAHLSFFAKHLRPAFSQNEAQAQNREQARNGEQVQNGEHARKPAFSQSGKGLRFPSGAEDQGADAVINSTHKTLASFTQTAILNLCSDRIDRYDLEDRLQAVESSSPSYPLMASLDINADLLERCGSKLIREWAESLEWFYEEAPGRIPGLRLMEHPMLDPTKLNLDMSAYGLDGNELENLLIEKGIFIELVTGNILMCMTGIGNKRCDYEKLIRALEEIAGERILHRGGAVRKHPEAVTRSLEMKMVPVKKERIPLREAAGRVCASSVIPYPPGIPIVCPGEVFDGEVIAYIEGRRQAEEKVIGVDDLGRVVVGKEIK